MPAGRRSRRVRRAIPGAGTGLIGLAERASLAGGRLEHGRTRGRRFPAAAPWLPMAEA